MSGRRDTRVNDNDRAAQSAAGGEQSALGRKRELLRALLAEGGIDPSRMPITRRKPDCGPLPLSYAQEELWLHDQIEPGSVAFNVVLPAVRFEGRVDPLTLRKN